MSDIEPGAGDEALFEALLERHGRLLRETIAWICPKRLGLQFDDIEQEARLRLWKALQREREILNEASYLYRVAVTATLDAVRRATARREEQLRRPEELTTGADPFGTEAREPQLSPQHSPERITESRLVVSKVRAALGLMSVPRRRAVGLHLQGFTLPEISRTLGWSEPRVRNLVYRGLQELRERLAAEGIEYETP